MMPIRPGSQRAESSEPVRAAAWLDSKSSEFGIDVAVGRIA